MKKVLFATSLLLTTFAIYAAPNAADIAAETQNQSTTFSTGAPVHSPWIVLQQATLNGSAGWNNNSTTTVVPSGSSTTLNFNITNSNSKTLYVFVANANNVTFSSVQELCAIAPNVGPVSYNTYSGDNCSLARSTMNAGTEYIYVTTEDIASTGASYASKSLHCNPSGSIVPTSNFTLPYQVQNGGQGEIVNLTYSSAGTCNIG